MLKKLGFLALGVLLAAGVAMPIRTLATEETDVCNFAPKFARLKAIQEDGAQNYIEAIRAQLAVRKSILKAVIDCAIQDINLRKAKLASLDPELKDSKAALEIARDLERNIEYYSLERERVDNLGIKGTQDTAAEIARWRKANYEPLAERQDALFLWNQNQSLFYKTSARFNQVKPLALSLKLITNDEDADALAEIRSKFEEAQKQNEAARAAIEQGDANALDLIHSSLATLSEIYKNFLGLAEKIK